MDRLDVDHNGEISKNDIETFLRHLDSKKHDKVEGVTK